VSGRRVRSFVAFAAALCASSASSIPPARAADATSMACIRAAEEGQAARDAGKLLRARELFASCVSRECQSVLRRDCTAWLDEAKRLAPSVVIVARDGSGRDLVEAKASVDGVLRQSRLDGSVIELDPGEHVVRVQMGAQPPVELRVVFGSGEKNRTIVVTMASAPDAPKKVVEAPTAPPSPSGPSRGLPAATYVFGTLGIVALGSFGYFAVRGKTDADHLRATCVPGCAPGDVSAVRTKLLVADVSLGVGLVSLVAATWFALRHGASSSSSPEASAWELRAAPSNGGARGELFVRF